MRSQAILPVIKAVAAVGKAVLIVQPEPSVGKILSTVPPAYAASGQGCINYTQTSVNRAASALYGLSGGQARMIFLMAAASPKKRC